MSAHDFSFTSIDGEPLPLQRFKGRLLLVVNTASECGFTSQYAALESLWRQYRARGLAVLGVPSNDFGDQEPGDEAAIKRFCATYYAIDFPLTDKQRVIGADAHPFFRWLVDELGEAAAPKWNFHKYLVGPDGELAGLWPSKVAPLDRQIVDAIEAMLP